jgi:hypothetical protein
VETDSLMTVKGRFEAGIWLEPFPLAVIWVAGSIWAAAVADIIWRRGVC